MPPAMSPSSGGRRRKSCDGQDPGDAASYQGAIQGADRGGVIGMRQQDCWALAWHGGVERGGQTAMESGWLLLLLPRRVAEN